MSTLLRVASHFADSCACLFSAEPCLTLQQAAQKEGLTTFIAAAQVRTHLHITYNSNACNVF